MRLLATATLGVALMLSACAINQEPMTTELTEEKKQKEEQLELQKKQKQAQQAQQKKKEQQKAALKKLKGDATAANDIAQDLADDTKRAKEAAESASSVGQLKLVVDRTADTRDSASRLAKVTIDTHGAATEALKAMTPSAKAAPKEGEKAKAAESKEAKSADGGDNNNGNDDSFWKNLGFGVGLSLTANLGSDERVKSASLDANGLVRVDEEEDAIARLVLETHYFGDCRKFLGIEEENLKGILYPLSWLGAFAKNDGDCGIGPFVAVQSGDDEIIDAVGIGLMIGFKRTANKNDTSSFNLGIGYIVDPDETVLGKGIEEGEVLPGSEAGSETVRTRKKAQDGILFLTSFSF